MRAPIIALLILACPLFAGADDKRQQQNDDWMQQYYQRPSPERFEEEVKKIQATGALQKEGARAPVAAFFSRLFVAADPLTMARWLKFIDGLPAKDQDVFIVALHLADIPEAHAALRQRESVNELAKQLLASKAMKLDKISKPGPGELDMLWGAFFATGSPTYALPVIRCAAQTSNPRKINMSQQAARWSLKSLCGSHAKLRSIKDDYYKTATPEEQNSLDELFKK